MSAQPTPPGLTPYGVQTAQRAQLPPRPALTLLTCPRVSSPSRAEGQLALSSRGRRPWALEEDVSSSPTSGVF